MANTFSPLVMLLLIIYASMVHKLLALSLWDCPGECLSLPNSWTLENNDDFLKLWKSDCAKLCVCGYDRMMSESGDCIDCNTWRGQSEHHKRAIPTLLHSCDVSNNHNEFICIEGFYYSSETNRCEECAQMGGVTCGHGLYFERCQKTEDLTCLPCTNPIPNETSQVYGSYSMVESCSFSNAPFQYTDGVPSCALYMTPTWDDYKCAFECKTNFIDISQGGAVDPLCVPCYEACSVGEYCRGGGSKTCHSCEGILGENMVWTPDTSIYDTPCRPQCANGFYKSRTNNQKCTPCLQNQKCSNVSEIFLGCVDQNPGECQPAGVVCNPGETFLYYQVYSLHAECRACSVPQLGLTFTFKNCSVKTDTVLHNCQNACPPGYFKAKNCTLTADIVCQRCSNPISMNGFQMVGPCGGYRDYTFAPCPSGYACDGSAKIYECVWPMFAYQGLCKCPHGTYLRGEKCSVVQCPSGQYPHLDSGICTPCTHPPSSSNHSITLEGVWGQDACACEEGYFIEEKNDSIRCWPCGDLSCTKNIQYQTPCPGVLSREPECLCKLPPGVMGDTDCRFLACEPELEKSTVAYSTMASLPPKLWNGSFWRLENQYETVEKGASLSSSITSIIAVMEHTLVYVLNHTSLWVTSKNENTNTWSTGMISNDLFIVGFRNNSNNVLLDISVCKDADHARFWLSFVMLSTFCGETYYEEDGESLTLCSNIELIELSQTLDNPACLGIQNTNLCAENMYRRWNNNIDSGIPLIRIFSMTMDFSGQNLYMAIGHEGSLWASEVYTYAVNYYADGVSIEEKRKNTFESFQIKNYELNELSNLVWANNDLFALVDGRFTPLTEKYFLGVERVIRFFSFHEILLRQLEKGPRNDILFALPTKPNNVVYEIDLWNGHVLEKYGGGGGKLLLFVFANSAKIFVVAGFNVEMYSINTLCPMDHISFFGGECAPMPCILVEKACGDNSLRVGGSTLCKCTPGYYLDSFSKQCQKCRANFFCPGDNENTPCPSNSNSDEGSATSISQCFCNKGFYKFKQNLCLPCPKGFWCLGQLSPPVRCTSGSSTLTTGAQSPVECQCLARTRGTDCKPCASTDICLSLSQDQQPRISAILLRGYGPWNADSILNISCMNWGVSIVYALPDAYLKLGKLWSWVIVSEPLPSDANDENLLHNISTCMSLRGLSIQEQAIYTRMTLASNVQQAVPCGLNLEWSGESSGQSCTCIAGYEKVVNPSNQFRWCSPCAIDTIRPRKSATHCVPCSDNNSHAPWLGMDHCICKEGYFMDHAEQKCTLESQPLYSFFSSPFLIIPLTITLVVLCFLGLWFVSFISI